MRTDADCGTRDSLACGRSVLRRNMRFRQPAAKAVIIAYWIVATFPLLAASMSSSPRESQGEPMRTFAVLLILSMSALAAGGAAWAKAPAELSKPVCTQYDDNAKQAARNADATAPATPAAPAAATAAVTPAPSSGNAPAAQAKGGSTSVMHERGAPRWQTLLPGMFR
jgi:hypothetical protein